jgi:hypothetical protein
VGNYSRKTKKTDNQPSELKYKKINQVVREANIFKSFKKWFDISPRRVTFKAEINARDDFKIKLIKPLNFWVVFLFEFGPLANSNGLI